MKGSGSVRVGEPNPYGFNAWFSVCARLNPYHALCRPLWGHFPLGVSACYKHAAPLGLKAKVNHPRGCGFLNLHNTDLPLGLD